MTLKLLKTNLIIITGVQAFLFSLDVLCKRFQLQWVSALLSIYLFILQVTEDNLQYSYTIGSKIQCQTSCLIGVNFAHQYRKELTALRKKGSCCLSSGPLLAMLAHLFLIYFLYADYFLAYRVGQGSFNIKQGN